MSLQVNLRFNSILYFSLLHQLPNCELQIQQKEINIKINKYNTSKLRFRIAVVM
jgi:hypothetical protein